MTEKKERKSGMVRVRGGFSDTEGIARINTIVQIDEFGNHTRILFANGIHFLLECFFIHPEIYLGEKSKNTAGLENAFYRDLYNYVFCRKIDIPANIKVEWRKMYKEIDEVIEKAVYNEVLDIIQYICQWIEKKLTAHHNEYYLYFNYIFTNEYVGYRFVDGRIVRITDDQEVSSIEDACKNPYEDCRIHMQHAVAALSEKKDKDYADCITESLRAVESMCQLITGKPTATVDEALKTLEESGSVLHPAFIQAFQTLYAYTSDPDSIRHAEGLFEKDVTFEDAKFMIVSCSTFINYLTALSGKGKDIKKNKKAAAKAPAGK